MRWPVILRVSVLLLLGLAVVMFTIQNLSRTTLLSFDMYVYAWQIARPVPVPWIMWGSFGVGVLLTSVISWGRQRRLKKTVSRLEQEALLRSAGRAAPPSAPAPTESPKPAPSDDWGR